MSGIAGLVLRHTMRYDYTSGQQNDSSPFIAVQVGMLRVN